jgi:hypothetical protein
MEIQLAVGKMTLNLAQADLRLAQMKTPIFRGSE